MFRSRRSGLVRRLWRSRVLTDSDGGRHPGKLHSRRQPLRDGGDTGEDEEQQQPPGGGDDPGAMCVQEQQGEEEEEEDEEEEGRTVTCCLFGDLRKERGRPVAPREEEDLAYVFLRRLKERSLEALLRAVESRGGVHTDCVLVPSAELHLGAQCVSPQSLVCRTYRWSELPLSALLKPLSVCHGPGDAHGTQVCCNPYHYSRLCGPESPPPPYSLSRSDEHKSLDSSLSYTETVPPLFSGPPHITPRDYTDTGTSIGSSTSSGRRSHWCSVAYWEQRTRVGRLYPAYEPSLNIFYDLPQGTGLCLGQLHANAYHSRRDDPGGQGGPSGLHGHHSHGGGGGGGGGGSSSSVQQIRSKIGYGIVLSREPDGVWVYNRSQHPVFVHSPTLDPPGARGLSVKRVMPGFSLKVFDYERSSWMAEHGVKPECQEGPWDPHSVRISFAKGWGPCYSRQFITSCPCWLEVLLNNHR